MGITGQVPRDRKTGYLQGGERRGVYRHTLKVMFVTNDIISGLCLALCAVCIVQSPLLADQLRPPQGHHPGFCVCVARRATSNTGLV